ncbi:hypothetical protein AB0O34_22605 [Sphaerisporangium sp. NPDC088356]|uniref:hypothetical protein n=1 Tax=Sphaerisporangium sp. NPDC088356 TaxID=3154871 RepID=UPI0034333354
MAKIRCICQHIITTSGAIPNPLEWKIISDPRFDDFEGLVEAEEVYRACSSMFRCPKCGRLWVYWDGFDGEPACYTPQSLDPAKEVEEA